MMDVASFGNLEKVLKRNPKILHIICHGFFGDKQNNILGFEKDIGILDKFDSDKFQHLNSLIRTAVRSGLRLVFINSCHSQGFAELFKVDEYPVRIAVFNEFQVSDEVAKEFSRTFYERIFTNNDAIGDAFRSTKELTKYFAKNGKTKV